MGFVVDQYNRVQAFVPETFWYIFVAIERQDEDEDVKDTQTVEFRWRRNHLFGMDLAVILYEQTVERPLATVIKVETKATSKW